MDGVGLRAVFACGHRSGAGYMFCQCRHLERVMHFGAEECAPFADACWGAV
ncbi:hypothetical protein BH20VER3_BH20VER3_18320 [soil metagenome]